MNRKWCVFFCLGAVIASVIGYVCGWCVGSSDGTELEGTALVDYPLADCYFDHSAQWVVVNRSQLFSTEENISVIARAQDIEHVKESLVLTTFPSGRGTTPEGYLYIYRNGALIKEIPYLSCTITDSVLRSAFSPMTKTETEALIGAELPPAV